MMVKDTLIGASAVQTLLRGLDLLDAVAAGTHDLEGLVVYTGLRRSTAHRLLAALARQGYLLRGRLKRTPNTIADGETFRQAIAEVAPQGYALDLEENDAGIRCVAAPIRDGSGQVVAAISVTSASIYTDEQRIEMLIPLVKEAARRISRELGRNDA